MNWKEICLNNINSEWPSSFPPQWIWCPLWWATLCWGPSFGQSPTLRPTTFFRRCQCRPPIGHIDRIFGLLRCFAHGLQCGRFEMELSAKLDNFPISANALAPPSYEVYRYSNAHYYTGIGAAQSVPYAAMAPTNYLGNYPIWIDSFQLFLADFGAGNSLGSFANAPTVLLSNVLQQQQQPTGGVAGGNNSIQQHLIHQQQQQRGLVNYIFINIKILMIYFQFPFCSNCRICAPNSATKSTDRTNSGCQCQPSTTTKSTSTNKCRRTSATRKECWGKCSRFKGHQKWIEGGTRWLNWIKF